MQMVIAASSCFNWDALSAIGTTAAVFVALFVWLMDLRRRRLDRRAAARLLAVRLISDVEQLSRVLLSNLREFDGGNREATAMERINHMNAHAAGMAKNGIAAQFTVQTQMDALDLGRFESLAAQVGIMEDTLSDSLTELLRRCINLQNVAKRIPYVGPEVGISGGLAEYYIETVHAQECAKRSVFQLYVSSGLLKTDSRGNPVDRRLGPPVEPK